MKRILEAWIIIALLSAGTLYAGVDVTLKSYQKARKGGKIVWIKAKKVIPGTTVKYVNIIENKEPEPIYNLVLRNDIPEHMRYIPGSIKCKSACIYLFSVDHGKHFAKPDKLMVKDKKSGKVRKARASEYTTVKWVIDTLPPRKKTSVMYKAKLL